MPESTEPKKYPPTEKRLRDLKKKGQFPKTELAEPTLVLIVFSGMFSGGVYLLFAHVNSLFEVMLYADTVVSYQLAVSLLVAGIGALLLVKFVMLIVNWVLINKSVINTQVFGFKIDKLNPVQGFKNAYGGAAIARSLRKVLELGVLLFFLKYVFDVMGEELHELQQLNNQSYFIYSLIVYTGMISLLFFVYGVCVGCIDFMAERFQFMKKNRMTFTEMKNEMKETEGSPEVKSKRKQIMREVMDAPITKGRRPNFAVANPTHILVPICYNRNIDRAPVVLKISVDDLALQERKRLMAQSVPILEHKQLARALYSAMKTGEDFVPKAFYKHIAIILSALRRQQKNAK